MELVIARNPDGGSSLPYLLRVPLGDGLVFKAGGTWPRTRAIFCYPVERTDWPADPEVVERVAVRSCRRRGAAIDLVLDRSRENRSQIVYTTGRGREMVFWQSPRTRRQARPQVRTPTARAGGLPDLHILADAHEQYPYRSADAQVTVVKLALPCGDYAVEVGGRLVARVERKSLADLVSSLTSGRLRFALGELSALPCAAVVVEDRFSRLFAQDCARPAVVVDGLTELQVRFPEVPIMFCESRTLAEQWTYRFLAAAHAWAGDEPAAVARLGVPTGTDVDPALQVPGPTTAEVRVWARDAGLEVPARGRLRPEVWQAWHAAHPGTRW